MKPALYLAASLLTPLLLTAGAAQAAPDASARAEVEYLLDKVSTSSCRFNRNGVWYNAKDARSHLQKKRDYMVKRDLLKNTEGFIEYAASNSSMSGKAYQIQCPGSGPVASAVWFSDELKRYRERK